MKIHFSGMILSAGVFLSSTTMAQKLSEPALFSRCYAQITGHPIPLNHAVLAKVKAGTMSALTACNSILDKTELNATTGLLTQSQDVEAQWTLNNFYSFHRTWFSANTIEQIQNYNDETAAGTRDIYDSTEPGLAVTRAAFAANAKFRDVLTLATGVHAIRTDDPAVRARIGWTVEFPGRRIYGNDAKRDENLFNFRALTGGFDGNSDTTLSSFLNIPRIETGELQGIRPTTESVIIPNVELFPFGSSKPGNTQVDLNYSFNFYKTLGGGVLGTPIYIMLNYGHQTGLLANGSTKLPRRWAQATMNTFLCANLPSLRESDVAQFVKTNSTAPFRNATSCVMCHANLDQMASTGRNVILAGTDYFFMQSGARAHAKLATVMTTFKPTLPSGDWASEPVPNYHRQMPTGKLYFRSFSGALINKPVQNIAELGSAIADTDDYYQCAAKKYFQYFTGIEVALYDRQDPRYAELNKQLSKESIDDRLYIEKLAAQLKQSQSVKQMIKDIISSSYYSDAKFRP